MSNIEKRYFEGTAEIRMQDGKETRSIQGGAIVFNRWSHDLGGFIERILPTAMDDVDLSNVIATRNHNFDKPLGKTVKGTLELEMKNDEVRFVIPEMPNTTVGNDTLEDIRTGNIDGASFMFRVEKDGSDWNFDRKDGIAERTVKKIHSVIELGPVTMPAYPDSSASRSVMDEMSEARSEFEEEKRKANEPKMVSVLSEKLKYEHLRTKF